MRGWPESSERWAPKTRRGDECTMLKGTEFGGLRHVDLCVSLGLSEPGQPPGSADPAVSVSRGPDQDTLSHCLTGG